MALPVVSMCFNFSILSPVAVALSGSGRTMTGSCDVRHPCMGLESGPF